jgi:hypothetical protein
LKVAEQNIITGLLVPRLLLEKANAFSIFKVLVSWITLTIKFTFLDRIQDE